MLTREAFTQRRTDEMGFRCKEEVVIFSIPPPNGSFYSGKRFATARGEKRAASAAAAAPRARKDAFSKGLMEGEKVPKAPQNDTTMDRLGSGK